MKKYLILFIHLILCLGLNYPASLFPSDDSALLQNPKKQKSKTIKLLVLIIASDNLPVYVEEQKIWRAYMHLDPKHVEAYFIKGTPQLPANYFFKEDVIWSQTQDCIIPGILNKTLLSMEALMPRIKEFDFVLRTNLSSFYVFPRLLKFLKTLPKKKCYCAYPINPNIPIGSGAGLILSTDLVRLLVQNKKELWNSEHYDDVAIGEFLKSHQIELLSTASRTDFLTLESWLDGKDNISKSVYHFRTKCPDHLRSTDEVYIQLELLKMFYH